MTFYIFLIYLFSISYLNLFALNYTLKFFIKIKPLLELQISSN